MTSLFFQRGRLALVLVFALGLLAGCSSTSDTATPTPTPTTNTVTVTGDLTGTVNWVATNKYLLQGNVFVTSGATLNIPAGTVVLGDVGSNRGTLIVLQGGTINATGTSTNPVVFTSSKAPGTRNYGDWGGILIIGNGPTNAPSTNIEGGIQRGGVNVTWGGNQATQNLNDNSGILRYVRIEFGGVAVAPNSETNGLTMYNVGRATTIEYVQVSYIGDDGFEWFGGNANAKYLVSYRVLDDDFDTDNGWSGKVQFGLAIRDNAFGDVSGSNSFESDNNSGGTDVSPYTTGTFSNMTIIGPGRPDGTNISGDFNAGAHIRRGSRSSIHNSAIIGYRTGVIIEGPGSYLPPASVPAIGATALSSQVAANSDLFRFANNYVVVPQTGSGVGNLTIAASLARSAPPPLVANTDNNATNGAIFQTDAALQTWINTAAFTNTNATASGGNLATLTGINANVWSLITAGGTPTLLPSGTSPLITGTASFTGLTTSGSTDPNGNFVTTTFRGAFGTTDWTTGWTNWNPQTTAY